MTTTLPELPFIARLTDRPGVYVFRDRNAPSSRPGHAVAGPFTSKESARLWILESLEAQLVDSRRAVWVEVCKALGTMSHDLGIELYLIDAVLHGKTLAQLMKYIPKPKVLRGPERRHEPDRRTLASGERV